MHSLTAQPPDLRHFALTTRTSRFHTRSSCLVAPTFRFLSIGSQFRSVPCRMRHVPTVGRPHAAALHFVGSGQLTAGLAPARVRPCWAHKKKRLHLHATASELNPAGAALPASRTKGSRWSQLVQLRVHRTSDAHTCQTKFRNRCA